MVTGQSDTVVIVLAVLGFLTSTVTLIVGAYITIKTRELGTKTKETHDLVNGLAHDLNAAQVGQASAEGVTKGEQAERDRQNGDPQPVTVVNPADDPVPTKTVG